MTQRLDKIRIFRKTLVGDTFSTLGVTEKLEFNTTRETSVANGFTTRVTTGAPRAIAEHPNPNEELSEQQDTGKDEEVITIYGAVSRAELITNQFMLNLFAWRDGSQESTTLPFGRFSIENDGNPHMNIDASATTGLEIRDLITDESEETQNLLEFILILSRGKAAS